MTKPFVETFSGLSRDEVDFFAQYYEAVDFNYSQGTASVEFLDEDELNRAWHLLMDMRVNGEKEVVSYG